MSTAKAKTGDGRTRNYATIVYPESANENWLSILGELCIPCFVSPLHDLDVNVETGEVKKPHYHVLFMFDGKKSITQVREIIDKIDGVGCEIVNSVRGYARYLCHMDSPDKAQYKPDDVRCFGGADYTSTVGVATDKYKAIREMMAWCVENDNYAYYDLLMYCSEERYDWFRVLCDGGTFIIKEFLRSKSWKVRMENERLGKYKDAVCDPGEEF